MLIVVLMVLSLIAGRLLQLQGVDRSAYAASAANQRLHTITLPATRGTISDRNGQPIAETVDARNVIGDPSEISDPGAVATSLAPLLSTDESTLQTQLSGPGQYALLASEVTPAEADAVLKLKLPGITTVDTSKRVYPDGTLASNVVGFVGSNGVGLGGLELSDQKVLAGQSGTEHYQVGEDGVPIPGGNAVSWPAVPGEDIRLTLQRDIQYEAQRAIAAQVKATKALSGTVLVENPQNGQILAMATSPGFNPNDITHANPATLGDPAVIDDYEPGSVIKAATVSAALQQGVIQQDSGFVIPNSYEYGGTRFHDAESHGTEHLTVTGILAESSNIGAIQIAKRVGAQELYNFLRAFGFGQRTGIGLPGESTGDLPTLSQWSGTTLPTLAFGQGLSVSALQVAQLYSTIADNGVKVQPTIIEGSTGSNGKYVAAPPHAGKRVISATVATEMRQILESVTTNEGTAPAARIPGYRIAGKTGTANRSNGRGSYSGAGYTATFVGMVPADHPKLVCEVVLERPIRGYYGGAVAAPVFKSVTSFALRTLGIAPTFGKPAHAALTW